MGERLEGQARAGAKAAAAVTAVRSGRVGRRAECEGEVAEGCGLL